MKSIQIALEKIGVFASWSTLILVLLMTVDVIMRYALGMSYLWLVELETYFFAMIFLLGAAICYQYDKHVRVDVFYEKKSIKQKALINLLGNVFLLLPWITIMLIYSYDYMIISLKVNERSAQPNGLPAVWLLKGILFFGFVLLFLQMSLFISQQIKLIFSDKSNQR